MDVLSSSRLTGEYLKHNRTTTQCGAGDPLEDLKARKQWVAWRWGPVRKDGKRGKIPINPSTRLLARTNDPSSWSTYRQALACKQEHGLGGIGFVFTEDDVYFGWDLDDCRDHETGWIHPAALALAARFGTYYEVSPSGTGIKGIGIGCKPIVEGEKTRCSTENTPWGGKIELYDQLQYFTITEKPLGGRGLPIRDAQDVLDSVYREFFPEPQKPVQAALRPDTNPTEDGELLKAGRNAKQLGPKFIALYDRGDLSWSGNDASKADNDLMTQLAYLTWHDAARMEALFSQSALGRRDKWTSRPDYRKTTIDYAIAHTSGRYEPEKYKPREGSTKTRDKLPRMAHHAVIGYGWEEITGDPRSGARDYAAFVVMLRAAWKANSLEIDMDGRDLMVAAGLGKRATAVKAIASLIDTHGVLVRIKDGSPGKAARYRIKDLTPSIRDHALIEEKFFTSPPPLWV